ncbi:hypothetical protein COLU111180_16965 [Cohnella lubricantis]|uniref:DUF5683 domain-containing protein n=1 Tax=Cohnella lubricantis TaxID=2163172 RepID=A0A841TD61_9BACL|nr:hypothetical protein [Cohnella lubricantis]MBB6677939.1 hypothetical protein [Cohnella lubricantis]MBP2119993.1 TM2 domain-containing membrane protein YozV [Cohnella lubricantis]
MSSSGYPDQPVRKKRKWVSALLSLLFPGTGHMYLGLMAKGIAIMLLLSLNICAIVYFAIEYGNGSGSGSSVLVIVLVSLLVPIQYFYSLFDALQQTEAVNDRHAAGWLGASGPNGMPSAQGTPSQHQVSVAGVVLLAAGGLALFSIADMNWTRWFLHSSGSMTGAVILFVIGGLIWVWERRGSSNRRG